MPCLNLVESVAAAAVAAFGTKLTRPLAGCTFNLIMQRSCKKVGRIIETRQGGKQNYFHLKVYYERNLLKIKFCIQRTKAQARIFKFAGPTVKQQQK